MSKIMHNLCWVALVAFAIDAGAAERANPANNGTPWVPPAQGDDNCPGANIVDPLPFLDGGNTCTATNSLGGWGGAGACTLPAGPAFYQGEDVIYQFSVGPGNSLTFDLPAFAGDLVLAIFSICGDGNSCEANSADTIGSGAGPETIGPISFTPGTTHYLYIDSYYQAGTQNSCGTYSLEVTGTLPVELLEFTVN
ncbi:MAG TPA: hypothetical protein VGB99_16875 [Acidobacteriota bacterium]|jgi:hypothetical protein